MAKNDSINEELLEKWNELKRIIEANEVDVIKNAQGNESAGVRARHGFRLIKRRAADITKISMGKTTDKSDDE